MPESVKRMVLGHVPAPVRGSLDLICFKEKLPAQQLQLASRIWALEGVSLMLEVVHSVTDGAAAVSNFG